MDKSNLLALILEFNKDLNDLESSAEEIYENRIKNVTTVLAYPKNELMSNNLLVVDLSDQNISTNEWKHLCLNFYLLHLLDVQLTKRKTNILSVKESSQMKNILENLISRGILVNIQPNLPRYVPNKKSGDVEDVIYNYTLLKYTVLGLYNCSKTTGLRLLVIPHCLAAILVGVLQIAYCPLKNPNTQKNTGITEDTYKKLLQDQLIFKKLLDNMRQTIHHSFFIKELMLLFQTESPKWFKKAISQILTQIIKSPHGIQNVTVAMLDGSDDDTTKTWKIIEILTKLILSCRKSVDFEEMIANQLIHLLHLAKSADHELLIFERLVASCTTHLFVEDEKLSKAVFVKGIIAPLLCFSTKEHKFSDGYDITDDIKQTVRLIHDCFTVSAANSLALPMHLLKTLVNIMFQLYHSTVGSHFKLINNDLKEILIKYFNRCNKEDILQILDNLLFNMDISGVLPFRNDIFLEFGDSIIVKNTTHSLVNKTASMMDSIYQIFDTKQKIILFSYLLRCISNQEKYFLTMCNNSALLYNEADATTVFERLLTTHRLLLQLSENSEVRHFLQNKPDDIIEYIKSILCSEQSDSQIVFIAVMILDNLVLNMSQNNLVKYLDLSQLLCQLANKTDDLELKSICENIQWKLKHPNVNKTTGRTEFDKALDDAFDPLLPVRGHGLLSLAKLIEKKDKQAMTRQQFLLNLFQLHLKDSDSFVYLNAIHGLASLADRFPDIILTVLCEEFADIQKSDDGAVQLRLKLGEVLIQVVKSLGDLTPKYKSQLLNTFLNGIKDDDHLMRTSSLSNLGEVCKILSYNLGTIITEVLVCVHAVITTDKAVEARRAAITVLRQLFAGLETEMLNFLREEILPIYRALKSIYYDDNDDVMRLQAQLALEELNENMKKIVFPNQRLHFEKNIVLLD